MKHLRATRLKSRRSSKKYYEKESSAIKARRRRYLLVEPSNEVVNRVMTTLQDTLCRDKAVVDEGLKNLGTWDTKKCESTKVSACKLACAHLVRLCLESRREQLYLLCCAFRKMSWTSQWMASTTLVLVCMSHGGNLTFMMLGTYTMPLFPAQ